MSVTLSDASFVLFRRPNSMLEYGNFRSATSEQAVTRFAGEIESITLVGSGNDSGIRIVLKWMAMHTQDGWVEVKDPVQLQVYYSLLLFSNASTPARGQFALEPRIPVSYDRLHFFSSESSDRPLTREDLLSAAA